MRHTRPLHAMSLETWLTLPLLDASPLSGGIVADFRVPPKSATMPPERFESVIKKLHHINDSYP